MMCVCVCAERSVRERHTRSAVRVEGKGRETYSLLSSVIWPTLIGMVPLICSCIKFLRVGCVSSVYIGKSVRSSVHRGKSVRTKLRRAGKERCAFYTVRLTHSPLLLEELFGLKHPTPALFTHAVHSSQFSRRSGVFEQFVASACDDIITIARSAARVSRRREQRIGFRPRAGPGGLHATRRRGSSCDCRSLHS